MQIPSSPRKLFSRRTVSRLHLTLPLCSLGFSAVTIHRRQTSFRSNQRFRRAVWRCPIRQTKSTASAEVAGASACLSVHPSEAAQTPMPLVAVRKGQDLSLDGYKTLGPAVMLQLGQPVGQRGVDVTLPFAFCRFRKTRGRCGIGWSSCRALASRKHM